MNSGEVDKDWFSHRSLQNTQFHSYTQDVIEFCDSIWQLLHIYHTSFLTENKLFTHIKV